MMSMATSQAIACNRSQADVRSATAMMAFQPGADCRSSRLPALAPSCNSLLGRRRPASTGVSIATHDPPVAGVGRSVIDHHLLAATQDHPVIRTAARPQRWGVPSLCRTRSCTTAVLQHVIHLGTTERLASDSTAIADALAGVRTLVRLRLRSAADASNGAAYSRKIGSGYAAVSRACRSAAASALSGPQSSPARSPCPRRRMVRRCKSHTWPPPPELSARGASDRLLVASPQSGDDQQQGQNRD
jgi:hypothetical protein